MPSFDAVSRIDHQEMDNAVNNVKKEIMTRYDFRNMKTEIDFNKKDKVINLLAHDDMKMNALKDMLVAHCVRRKIDPKCLDFKGVEPTSQGNVKMAITVKEGIPEDVARKMVKMIKDSKLKVQAAMQGDEVRVSAKKIDDLQEVMGMIRAQNYGVPVQFINMKRD